MEKVERILAAEDSARKGIAEARDVASTLRSAADAEALRIRDDARAAAEREAAAVRAELVGAAKADADRFEADARVRLAESLKTARARTGDAVTRIVDRMAEQG